MAKYKKGKIVKGSITGFESYGVFVNLDNYYTGLIHISEISNSYVKDINDFVEIGETIYVKVLDVDEAENHVKLSIKDIDYRIDKIRADKTVIKETGSGFLLLEEHLSIWIREKIEELR